MKIKKIILAGIICLFCVAGPAFASVAENSTRRFGVFVGANNGGRGRTLLRYAVSDARAVSRVFSEMGGIAGEDSVLLVEPSVREISNSITALHEQVIRARGNYARTEIVFYYSGHSDEDGLLLNRERYSYRDLREQINRIPSDMRIVILDSCASGVFTRIKGGSKAMPFLMDSSVSAEGYAFLTSSSADEVSQESDRISASYFTHSLVTGLRGAADMVGDGRVTLNELYRFAYTETLARTETSMHGAQHPSYDIQINGTGDLVLTDIRETSAIMAFDEVLIGRLSIRDSSDYLIAEINKTAVRALELGLEPGLYRITLQRGDTLSRTEVTLVKDGRAVIAERNFTLINADPTRRRGGEDVSPLTGGNLYTVFVNSVAEPFPYPLVGFVNIARGNHRTAQVGFINWNTGNFDGLQVSFVNTTMGNLSGVQASFINTTIGNFSGIQAGFVNTTVGEMTGPQAGFVNTAIGRVTGPQIGFVNVATQGVRGFQLGFVNYTDNIEDGIPIGFISIVRQGGYQAIEYSFSEFHPVSAAFKIGLEKFYTNLLIGYNPTTEVFKRDGFAYYGVAFGMGFGSVLPIGKIFFFNPELNWLSSSPVRDDEESYLGLNFVSFVPSFGINIGKHFSITAGPSVTWASAYIYHPDADDWMDAVDTNVSMPRPLFGYNHEITPNQSIVIGARAALRLRF